MPRYSDRVKDTFTTTGTGNLTVSGTPPAGGFRSFNTAFGTVKHFDYAAENSDGSEYETGRGYLSASTTLVRVRVYTSSNADALVNWSAGTKTIIATVLGAAMDRLPDTGQDYARARNCYWP